MVERGYQAHLNLGGNSFVGQILVGFQEHVGVDQASSCPFACRDQLAQFGSRRFGQGDSESPHTSRVRLPDLAIETALTKHWIPTRYGAESGSALGSRSYTVS